MIRTISILALTAMMLSGCGGESGYKPIDTSHVVFWDGQAGEVADLVKEIVADFNRDRPEPKIESQFTGNYSDIYRKVLSSLQGGTLPAMAVSYESMASEYAEAGAVVALDDYMNDPVSGLTPAELEDFFPVVIETNRYPAHGNRMLTFPFCKSILMMYFNIEVLSEAGIDAPPRTWDEFLTQCRQIKERTGKTPYAVSVDASTIDGMIYSMGGELVKDGKTLFDSEAALKVFQLFETLSEEKLAYQIPPDSYDDRAALVANQTAFMFRSSRHRIYLKEEMNNPAKWGMAAIPQADPAKPATVLYGPNICVFKTTPEQQQIAWEFIRYFTSPEITARWALGSGYLPIRKSAAEDPSIKAFFDAWPYNRADFDCLAFARSEPNLPGWQEIRDLIETAQAGVLAGSVKADEAASKLKTDADAVLAAAVRGAS